MKYFKLAIVLLNRNFRWILLLCKHRGKWYRRKIFGKKMEFRLDGVGLDLKEENILKQLAMDGIREKSATEIMKNFIQPGDVLLEAGANIGYYVLLEASLLKNKGKIYAIEPEPKNIELLKKNVSLNKLDTLVEVHHMAFSDKSGVLPLYLSKEANLHSFIKPKQKNYQTVMVKMSTIDEFMKKRSDINFIRMDIEGYECKVIDGMKKFLKKKGPLKLFIELHPQLVAKNEMIRLLTILKNSGFKLHTLISHDNTLRDALSQVKIETMSLEQFIQDPRISEKPVSFEAFFIKE